MDNTNVYVWLHQVTCATTYVTRNTAQAKRESHQVSPAEDPVPQPKGLLHRGGAFAELRLWAMGGSGRFWGERLQSESTHSLVNNFLYDLVTHLCEFYTGYSYCSTTTMTMTMTIYYYYYCYLLLPTTTTTATAAAAATTTVKLLLVPRPVYNHCLSGILILQCFRWQRCFNLFVHHCRAPTKPTRLDPTGRVLEFPSSLSYPRAGDCADQPQQMAKMTVVTFLEGRIRPKSVVLFRLPWDSTVVFLVQSRLKTMTMIQRQTDSQGRTGS